MQARCELLVTQVFELAVRFMVASADHLMTKWLKGVDAAKHVVVLHNNEVNTYDEVIRTLERCLKVNRQAAVDFATIVDRIGKSNVLIVDKSSEAKSMAKRISVSSRVVLSVLYTRWKTRSFVLSLLLIHQSGE